MNGHPPINPPALPRLAALAVVIHEGHALLVRRRNPPDAGLWGFPGGHVEPGETALAAAARELAEETGVTAAAQEYLTNIDLILRDPAGAITVHYLLAAVLCEYRKGVPVAADDAQAAEWIPLQKIADNALPMSARVGFLTAFAQTRLARRETPVKTSSDSK